MRYQPAIGITHQHISDLNWDQLQAAVTAGSVSVEDAATENIARYELLQRAINMRIIKISMSRMHMREVLLAHYQELAPKPKEQ
jgi:hypothetical protein